MSAVAIPPVINDPAALARSLFPQPLARTQSNRVPVLACLDNIEFLRSLPAGHCKLIVGNIPSSGVNIHLRNAVSPC